MTGLKVGDRVDVTRTEAVRLTVESARRRPQRDAARRDDLRNRLTVSVLLGWDNQFSGKVIQAANGQTTGGAPISLDETTYDEVFGRIGMFKIGVGYRTTPRTEGVVNFVWSSSEASETATRIGTVGAIPLDVNFTEYQVPGASKAASGGSSRARGSRPSWATSSASTGTRISGPRSSASRPRPRPGWPRRTARCSRSRGRSAWGQPVACSIGIGPFEVMAETQLRFMGGLSDVDWLVEEGLRDINSESSRWSLPLLFGARIRF